MCSLSPSCSLLGILLTEGRLPRLPPNLSLICWRDLVIFGECMVVCILTLSSYLLSFIKIVTSWECLTSWRPEKWARYCWLKDSAWHLYLKIMRNFSNPCLHSLYWSLPAQTGAENFETNRKCVAILKYFLIRSHNHLIKCVSYSIDTFRIMSNIGSEV